MNQLLNIKIEYKNGKPETLVIDDVRFNRFDLLAFATRTDDKKLAWAILKTASQLFHWQDDQTFNALYGSVAMEVTRDFQNNEFRIHQRFNEQVTRLFGNNAKVITKINYIHHQPDSWICINNEEIPVEMKLKKFDKRALSQLLRYMKHYNSSKGIAVGSKLDVDLPENITFISTDQLR